MNTQTNKQVERQRPYLEQIHLSDYLNIIRKRKRIILLFSLAMIGLATVISLYTTPMYQATTQIIIERQPYAVTNAEESFNEDIGEMDFYQTQYNLLQSRGLAQKVIQELELWKVFQTGNLNASVIPRHADMSKMIDWYLGSLQIEPVRGSRLINISFLSPSAENAARVANAHAHAFIEESIQMKVSNSQHGLDWITSKLQEQKEKVESSQRSIYEYKRSHGVTSFEDRQNIVSQKLMDLNADLTRLKSERLAKQAVYDQLMNVSVNRGNIFSLPEVAQDPVILNLRNQLIELKTKRQEMSTNYGPIHPKMIDLNLRIEQIEQEIRGEVQRLGRSIKVELDRALAYEQSIQHTLNAQKGAALSLNEKSIDYDVLHQEAQINQQIYDFLLKQAEELGLSSAFKNSNINVIDKAEVPLAPVRPRTFLNIFLSIVVSMFMGPFLAFFSEYMDRTIKTPEDIPRRLGIPMLGVVPYYKTTKNKRAALIWDDSYDRKKHKVYYLTGDLPARFIPNVKKIQRASKGQTLFIESSTSDEGKTTVVANAAISLARSGLRILAIDADIDKPALNTMFGIKDNSGLVNAITSVLSQDISRGNLNEYSVDDLFFLISLKRLSGSLTVTNDFQAITSTFENGRLMHIQSRESPSASRLGTMLVRSRLITAEQLKNALAINQRNGKPLGYILINAGYITHEKLKGPLKLQMEEQIQKVFSWRHGTFTFESQYLKSQEDEKIHFNEDYTPVIRRMSTMAPSRFLEREVLSGIAHCNEPNVWLMSAGTAQTKPHGPVYILLFSKFLEILKKHFDVILVDTPPVLDIPDAAHLSSLGDGVIYVVQAGNLNDRAITAATSRLKEAGATILGVVLNQAKVNGRDYV